jgi:hypothetical protein
MVWGFGLKGRDSTAQAICLRSLLRSPKDQWIRVYGCPEDMPINRSLLWSSKDHWFKVYGCPEDMPGATHPTILT